MPTGIFPPLFAGDKTDFSAGRNRLYTGLPWPACDYRHRPAPHRQPTGGLPVGTRFPRRLERFSNSTWPCQL